MSRQELIDKQALIDELMKIPGVGSNSDALETIKRFPSYKPQKPVVPKSVADWFERNKDNLEFAIWELCVDSYNAEAEPGIIDWIQCPENKPIETFIRMKDGYVVEKEPLYYVLLPDSDDKAQFSCYTLAKRENGKIEIKVIIESELGTRADAKLTEKEIKEFDERYWPFAVPVEEVAEG